MKLITQAKALQSALAAAASIVKSNSPEDKAKLEFDQNIADLTGSAFPLPQWIKHSFPAESDDPIAWSKIIPVRLIREFLSSVKPNDDDVVVLKIGGESLVVKVGDAAITLTLAVDPNFPEVPTGETEPWQIELDASTIGIVSGFSSDEQREEYNGVFLIPSSGDGGDLRLMAYGVDGRNMGIAEVDGDYRHLKHPLFIPMKLCDYIKRNAIERCALVVSPATMSVSADGQTFWTARAAKEQIPNLASLHKFQFKVGCVVEMNELMKAVHSCNALRGIERHTDIVFEPDENGLRLHANNRHGMFETTIPCRIKNSWPASAYPSEQLIRFAQRFDSEVVKVEFTGEPRDPLRLSGEAPWVFMTMPLVAK